MMNKYKKFLLLCCTVLMGALFINNASGPANNNTAATGSPFDGQSCNSCHSGGSFGTTVSMQLLESGNPVTTYLPGTNYTLRVTIGGTGGTRYGFQTTAAFQGTNNNINTWGTLPGNVHNTALGGHNYIEHNSPILVASNVIDLPWTAPSSTTTVVFYTAGNRVNFNGSTSGDHSATGTLTITTGCAPITITPGTLPNGTIGTAYSQALSQTGGVGTVTYSAGTGLPPGITLSGNTLSGTPTTAGTYTFDITATGSNGCSSTQSFTIVVSCPTITVNPTTLPNGTVGTSYNQTITQTGGSGTYTFTVGTGLPPGLTLNTNGTLSGTPTTAGTYTFTVTATGNGSCTGTRTYTVVIGCPTITINPSTLPNGTIGVAYNQTITQSGGSGTFTYTVGSGLPPGLVLNTNGTLSGTPTTAGTYTFTITGTSGGCSGSTTYTITISCPTITLNPATLPNGTVGTAYPTQTITQTGGTGTFTYTVGTGFPPGLNLATNGNITGTPTVAGTYTFTITGTSGPCTGTRTYTVVIGCPTITINPGTLANMTVGSTINQAFTQTGGTGTFTWTTTGTLPPGLTFSGNTLSGTPTTPGTYTFTVTATNSTSGCTASQSYTVNVSCPTISLNPGTLPNGAPGQAYNQTITVTGSTNTYTFTSTGTLPPGVTLSSGGVLSGTPTANGTYTFDITATDQYGCNTTTTYTIVVACPTIALSPSTLPPGNVGFNYNQQITVTGSTNTFTYTSSGTLPPGVTLSSGGLLSGTATTAGTYTFDVTATDQFGCTTTTTYTVVISPCAPLVLNPSTLPDEIVNTPYSETITQTGGTGAITWTFTGTLPPGLTLDPNTGVLSGTPTTTGTYNFTIIATDANTCTGTQSYTINIDCPNITLAPGTLPADTAGMAYNQAITQTGSTGTTFTYAVSSGTLPGGITLDPNTGVFSGTANTTGAYTFDITVTDEFGCSATISYTLDVVCPVIVINETDVDTIYTNTPYTATLTTTGGVAPFTYSVSGTLPGGITLDPNTGVLSGTTTDFGQYTITVTATDANGCTATQTYTVIVNWPLSVNTVTAGKESVTLLPNIVTERTTAKVVSNIAAKAQFTILDITGKVVYKHTADLKKGTNMIDLDLSTLSQGSYLLHIKPLGAAPAKFIKH